MVRALLETDKIPPGVWLPEQVIELETYLPAMAEKGWNVEIRPPSNGGDPVNS